MDDLCVYFGGAIKARPDSTVIEGLLIPYGGPEDLDHDGEFFTAKTDIGIRLPGAVKLHYNHGINAKVGGTPLAWAQLERTDEGIKFTADLSEDLDEWLDEEREKAKKYQALTLQLAREGKLGASSGAAGHLVEKKSAGKGHHLTRWPTAEASVTPHPSSPRTFGTVSVKALQELPDLEALAGKCCGYPMAMEYEPDIPAEATMAALSRLNDHLFYHVVSMALRDEKTPLAERITSLQEAFNRHRDMALRIIEAILGGEAPEDTTKALKSISTLWGPSESPSTDPGSLCDGETLIARTQAVCAAVAGVKAEYGRLQEYAVKEGRSLSNARRERIQAMHDSTSSLLGELAALLKETEPPSKDDTPAGGTDRASRLDPLRLQTRLLGQQLGVTS